jgi:hypothetical protein
MCKKHISATSCESAALPRRPMAPKADKQTAKIGEGKPGPGRPKGLPNRTTALLKDAILKAGEKAGGKDGLVGYLETQAKENPGPFMALLGKVLPMQMTGPDDGPIQTQDVNARGKLASRIAGLASRGTADDDPE